MKNNQIITGMALTRSQMKKVSGGTKKTPKTRYRCDCGGGAGIVFLCTTFTDSVCVPSCCVVVGACNSTFDMCYN